MAWPSGKAEACKASIPQFESGCHLLLFGQIVLYLVATPIGNLQDITLRALETLKTCDYILCEDTRHTRQLLSHYEIQKPLKSFHKFNEALKEDTIIHDLKSGQQIALVSDAGTPGISDPGEKLVNRCISEGIDVQSIPGPCAAVVALSCSGFATSRFQFYGFLPRKAGELRHVLQEILVYSSTTICYESPQRLENVLELLQELAPERKIAVCRELTKKFEELKRGTAQELLAYWQDRQVKGEIVLLIEGKPHLPDEKWQELSPEEHVRFLEETYRLSRHDAIKMAAEVRGVPKREIYNRVNKKTSL